MFPVERGTPVETSTGELRRLPRPRPKRRFFLGGPDAALFEPTPVPDFLFLGSAIVNPFMEVRDILYANSEYPTFHVEGQPATPGQTATRRQNTLNLFAVGV